MGSLIEFNDTLQITTDAQLRMRSFFYQTPTMQTAFSIDSFYDVLEGRVSASKYRGKIVLIGIAGISLLVGGIGIMNTMYTTVLERTKEIGVMKAIGARNKHILYLVLIEAGLYGLGGGLVGAVLGIGLAKLTEFVFTLAVGPAFLVIEINWWLVSGTLLFSFIVGCLSGIAPARRASQLNPVDSLRYE